MLSKVVSLSLLVVQALAVAQDNVDYHSWSVVDVFPANVEIARQLQELDIENLDWMPVCVGYGERCQAAVPQEGYEQLMSFLVVNSVRYNKLERSLGEMIDAERERIDRYNKEMRRMGMNFTRASAAENNPWDLEFHDYTSTAQRVREIAAENPDITTLITLGQSYEGRDIVGLRIGLNPSAPKIVFDGCIHAREWITTATVMYIINQLVDGYNQGDADTFALLNRIELHITPIANPDGYQWSHTNNRLWRKTRSPNTGSTCIGTDPNRNSDSNFGGPGTSNRPCSDSYHGPFPFSEPEVAALRDYVGSLTNVALYNNVHAVANLLLSPWGYTRDLPPDHDDHQLCHAAAAASIQSVNGNRFRYGPIYTAIYPASGGFLDWLYDAGVAKYSVAWELGGGSFTPPASFIVQSGAEIWAGMQTFIDCALANP